MTQAMLAGKADDLEKLVYPVLASVKLDGVRALVIDGVLMSRNLKPIPNRLVQQLFKDLPPGLDGELICGAPTEPDAYRKTMSAVMGDGNSIRDLTYWIFDNFRVPGGFQKRFKTLGAEYPSVSVVPHVLCKNAADLIEYEAAAVDAGHEGVMVRSLDGPYKHGRSTAREGYLLKVKRFEDANAVVIGVEELMHNGNQATTNALGHTERSTHQANLVGLNSLGALIVRGAEAPYIGVEFNIGTGFKMDERVKLWSKRAKLIGQTVKFKYFPTGSKDRPRFPVFLGWRHPIDA